MALGTVVTLQQVEQAGHVGPDLLHQAVLDGAHGLLVALQQAPHQFVVIPVAQGPRQPTVPPGQVAKL